MNIQSSINTTKKSTTPFGAAVFAALTASVLLLVPITASLITDEMNWSVSDFITAWGLFFGTVFAYKLVTRKMSNLIYRAAAGLAAGTALFLVWSNLAVGLIGSENNPANIMYLGVLAALLVGSLIVRFRPHGMVLAMFVTAITQILVTIIAIIGGLGAPENTPLQLVMINGFFITLWTGSALLFWYAARRDN